MNKGWIKKRLGEVCTIDKRQGIHRGLPYIGLEHIESNTARFIGSPEPQAVKSTTFRFTQEHVLYGRLRPYLNKAHLPEFEGHCSTEIYPLKPSRELLREYLLRWLLTDSTCLKINKTCRGARMPRAKMGELMRFELPVPPLEEQKRTVAKLDEAFARLAKAKENAEKNLQNARALFESHLQAVFTQRDGGWPTKQLGDVCDFEGGSQPPKSEFFYSPKGGYVRFLQIRDFGSEKHVTFIPESKKNRLCREDDIMIGRYGASVGKILTGKAGAYNVALMKTIPDLARLDRRFFYHYLVSGAFQERLIKVAARSAQNGFSKEDIYGFPVPVPPLEEQKRVTEQLGPLSEETQRLARLYDQKLESLDSLEKSILHEAFSGNL